MSIQKIVKRIEGHPLRNKGGPHGSFVSIELIGFDNQVYELVGAMRVWGATAANSTCILTFSRLDGISITRI
jgi:hypothetical protein